MVGRFLMNRLMGGWFARGGLGGNRFRRQGFAEILVALARFRGVLLLGNRLARSLFAGSLIPLVALAAVLAIALVPVALVAIALKALALVAITLVAIALIPVALIARISLVPLISLLPLVALAVLTRGIFALKNFPRIVFPGIIPAVAGGQVLKLAQGAAQRLDFPFVCKLLTLCQFHQLQHLVHVVQSVPQAVHDFGDGLDGFSHRGGGSGTKGTGRDVGRGGRTGRGGHKGWPGLGPGFIGQGRLGFNGTAGLGGGCFQCFARFGGCGCPGEFDGGFRRGNFWLAGGFLRQAAIILVVFRR